MAKQSQRMIESLRLDRLNKQLWKGEAQVHLTRTLFEVFCHLVDHKDQLVKKEELLDKFWGADGYDQALTKCVSEIRAALKDDPKNPQYIKTDSGYGYRFIGPLVDHSQSVKYAKPGVQNQEPKELKPESNIQPSILQTPLFKAEPTLHFVGREAEMEKLHRWLDRSLAGERQLVFVTGEPGIGKTTLVRTFLREVAASGAAAIARGQCIEQYGSGEAYLPVLEAIGRLCRDPRAQFVVEWMKQYAPTWLVQMPTLVSPAELEVVQRKVQGATQERMLREMSEGIEVLTEQVPFILVLEDLHWSDVSTLDLLSSLARRVEPARLLIIGTYRPEEGLAEGHPLRAITQELHGHRQCEALALSLLSEANVCEYLQQRFPTAMLPTRLPETLYRNTEGSPLFLTAVVDDLLERGVIIQVEGRWVLQKEVDSVAAEVPVSIRQLLTRQIDRLNSQEQQIVQAASVAGQEFSCAAVAAAVGIDTVEVEACCEGLVRRQHFLLPAGYGEWPDGTQTGRYRFRHALYQYLWNERVPTGKRQQFHMRIGERLEQAYGNRSGEIAAELAVHFEEGRDYQRAVRCLQQAAQNVQRFAAHQDALRHLTKGLELLDALPDTTERTQDELGLQVLLGLSLAAGHGYAAPEVERTYNRARELCRQLGKAAELFPILRGLWAFYVVLDDQKTARELAEQCLSLAQEQQRIDYLTEANTVLGYSLYYVGELETSRVVLERGLKLYESHQGTPFPLLAPQDPGVACFSLLPWVLWMLGYPDQALQRSQDALRLAQNLDHPFHRGFAQWYSTILHFLRREPEKIAEHGQATIQIGVEHGLDTWTILGTPYVGIAKTQLNELQEGISILTQSLATWRAVGIELTRPYLLGALAEAYGTAGQFDTALNILTEALQHVTQHTELSYQPALYHLRGELTLAQSPEAQETAEADFRQAVAIARAQGGKSIELRATTSLARLWQRQGKKKTARKVLSEIYGWFSEGFDTPDLQAASSLLKGLT